MLLMGVRSLQMVTDVLLSARGPDTLPPSSSGLDATPANGHGDAWNGRRDCSATAGGCPVDRDRG